MIITSANQRSPHKLGDEMDDYKLVPLLVNKGFEASLGRGQVNVQTDGYRSVVGIMSALDEMGLQYSLRGIDQLVESISDDLMVETDWAGKPGKSWISTSRSDREIRLRVLKAYEIYDRVVRSVQHQ